MKTYLKLAWLGIIFLLSTVLSIVAFLLVYFILGWILPIFAIGKDHLPWWLSYFDTPDNPLDGDEGFITKHAPFKGKQTGIKQYINRCQWLRRNPAYGLDYAVMGRTIRTMPRVISGDSLVSDGPNITTGRPTGLSGHVLISADNCFEWYYVRQWKNKPKCLRIRAGWKLSGYINEPNSFPLGTRSQFVCTIKLAGKFTI